MMDRISNLTSQNGYYSGLGDVKDTRKGRMSGTETVKGAKGADQVELSDRAKKLLKELQKSYGNMDFIVADCEDEKEAASYLSRGTGEYSVLLSSDELEKMASDDKVKEKNMNTLDEAVKKLEDLKQQLAGKGEEVSRIGIVLGDDGKVSYFAELEKVSQKQRERIEHQRSARKEEAAKAQKAAEKKEGSIAEAARFRQEPVKKTMVFADSVEELGRKIGQVDWDRVKETEQSCTGARFDLTI